MKENLHLIDPWRARNPELRRFTWRSTGPVLKQSRLDFMLISEDIYNQVADSDILAGYKTDHSGVLLNIKTSDFKHGKGFWKYQSYV